MKNLLVPNRCWITLLICSLSSSPLIAADDFSQRFSSDPVKAYMRPVSETLFDSNNNAPQVGRLTIIENDGLAHGSGFLIKREDGSRDKIMTSAHNFFDDQGELRAPLSRWRFELGTDVKSPNTEIYGLKKIECATSDPSVGAKINDQCLVTLDREISDKNLALLRVWQGHYEDLVGEITTYFVGYHGHADYMRTKRTLNRCGLVRFNKRDQKILSDCNNSKGMSGGVHGITVEGKLQVIGIITGTLFETTTNKLMGNYSVRILDEYDENLMVTVTRETH